MAQTVGVSVLVVDENVTKYGGTTGCADRDGLCGRILDDEVRERAVALELNEGVRLGHAFEREIS